MRSHHPFLWLAIVLLIAWFVLKFVVAMTGGFLHLLWIAAIIFALIWVVRHLSGGSGPTTPVV